MLLLLSRFSRVQLCATPQTAAHQAPPSLGFSRQEHWSGLPLPSPMHEWKVKVKSLSHVWLLATPWTVAHQAPPSMWFSRQGYWSGCHCLLQQNSWDWLLKKNYFIRETILNVCFKNFSFTGNRIWIQWSLLLTLLPPPTPQSSS